MAHTTAVYARIDTSLKERAEAILSQLGITPSAAIQMLYSQVVLNRGLPFVPSLPHDAPLAFGSLSRSQVDTEIGRGVASLEAGKGISERDVDEMLREEFGL